MANVERTYIIPLRKGFLKASRYKRAKKAVNTAREFLVHHMKSEDVRLGVHLNLEIWKNGIRNPPSRVKVNVIKDDKGVVRAELFGYPVMPEVKEVKKEAKKEVKKETPKVEEPKKVIDVKSEVKKVEPEVKKPEAKVKPVEKPKVVKAKPAQ